MATLPEGTRVTLTREARESLRFVPPPCELVIVVHPAALRARFDRHTQVAGLTDAKVVWAGALGEDLVEAMQGQPRLTGARADCAAPLLEGDRLWEVVRPGALVRAGVARPLSTVYDGSDLRPWVVVGETEAGSLLAAPLNEASNPKWWTPIVTQAEMRFTGNVKDSQVELAHIWTLPAGTASEGRVLPSGAARVEAAIRDYFAAA